MELNTGQFYVERAMKMGNMGVIFHGWMESGEIGPGFRIRFELNGQTVEKEVAAISQAGHLPGGRYRLELHILLLPREISKFRPNSIPKGPALILKP